MRSFMAINLSQFPESLVESELFGHRKGAFTGATESHEGVLARCSPHGAIFLDEIGDVSVPIQIKLLQVLQERTFSPVGSHEKVRFHGRVIAATNHPLDDLRRQGRFRDDFFYRLCSDVIEVPSLFRRLQECPGELRDLLGHVVQRLVGEESPALVDTVAAELARHPGPGYAWPGNVRELEQAVRRILVTGHYSGEPPRFQGALLEDLSAGMAAGVLNADALLAGYSLALYERHGRYEEVARRMGVDRRTARKYVLAGEAARGRT